MKRDKETKGMKTTKINPHTALAKVRHSPAHRSAAEEGLGDPDADGVPCGKPGMPGSKDARGVASVSQALQPSFVLILQVGFFFFILPPLIAQISSCCKQAGQVHYPKPQQLGGS